MGYQNTINIELPSAVQQMASLSISGNVVPMQWFKTLTFDNGKPDTNSILILSDIVYWYRPTEIRDERTGAVIGLKKKFSEDLLRKSYADLEIQFGLSSRQLRECLCRLEKKGLIKRVFRTIHSSVGRQNNVMYLQLFPEKVQEITAVFPEFPVSQGNSIDPIPLKRDRGAGLTTDSFTYSGDPITFKRDRYNITTGQVSHSNGIGMTLERDSYPVETEDHIKDTNITSEISSKISSLSSKELNLSSVKPSSEREMILNLVSSMVSVWNDLIPSLAVNHITKSLSQDLQTIFTTVLGSDVLKWKTVCQNFQSSKFLMGEAEGVRIKPSLSWLVNPHKNHVEHVLFKSHFTFDDRVTVMTDEQRIESLRKEIDETEPHAELRKLRRALCDQDFKVYRGYIKPAEFRLKGQTLEILPITSKARDYLTSEWALVMNHIVCEQFGYQLTIL